MDRYCFGDCFRDHSRWHQQGLVTMPQHFSCMLCCKPISPASDNRQFPAMHMPHCLVLGCVVVVHSDLDELIMCA